MNSRFLNRLKCLYNLDFNSTFATIKLWNIEIRLFYLYRRDYKNIINCNIKSKIYPCLMQPVGNADIKNIAMRFGDYYSEKKMLKMLSKGYICLGLRYNNEIISLRWCNFEKCDSKLLSFRLNENEVYITGAITAEKYRGKNVAPYFSCQTYEYLYNLGRTVFYSIVPYHNVSAIRFHQKFNDRPFKLYFYIELFKKYRMRFPLMRYRC